MTSQRCTNDGDALRQICSILFVPGAAFASAVAISMRSRALLTTPKYALPTSVSSIVVVLRLNRAAPMKVSRLRIC
nr:hypothetical protein [Bradyrhizobium manausense]